MATIEELNEGELTWVDANLTGLRKAGVDVEDPESLGRFFDGALTDWQALPEQDRPDPNPVINMLGVGLGQCVIGRSDLRWVIATDEHSTELALHRARNDILIYPANAVAKRWVDGEVGFMPGFVVGITSTLEDFSRPSD